MTRMLFNDGWTVGPNVSVFTELVASARPEAITLPHDALLSVPRIPDAPSGKQSGYAPGGAARYRKSFDVPDDWKSKRVAIEFQGVYRDAMVFVNDSFVTQRPNGYTTFRAEISEFLRFGEKNTIRVEARSHLDSRWYSGMGMHRDVVLIVNEHVRIADDGLRVTTLSLEPELAVVEVATEIVNSTPSALTVELEHRITASDGRIVATRRTPVTIRAVDRVLARQRFTVASPETWSAETPSLYTVDATIRQEDNRTDDTHAAFGIRVLQLDPHNGLRVNGRSVKLRGACIHHDNGPLGAAAWPRAEERRVELLKQAGFNAIRPAHNPMSQAMLDACDRIGMYVMDESFDMWTDSKNPFDYSISFPEWWARDLEALVAKDYNHPSVIMYCTGNEVLEAGSPFGAYQGRLMAERIRSLDRTRYITNGVSGFVGTIYDTLQELHARARSLRAGGINDVMSELGAFMDEISRSDKVTNLTEETHSVVDVVGLNYAHERYLADAKAYPERVVVGTETLAKDIQDIWPLVVGNSHVIGDFTWTGWDYLGEAGLGVTVYEDESGQFPDVDEFPAVLAWCGDFDITGFRRPASYFREIVFGLRSAPYIAVFRPKARGRRSNALNWAWTDTFASWSLDVPNGTIVDVEVYSADDAVDLFLNGAKVATIPTGRANGFRGRAQLPYSPGELIAVGAASADGRDCHVLRSASGPLMLSLAPDRDVVSGDGRDLCFITIELLDDHSVVYTSNDLQVTVEVDGPGVLQALGSATASSTESYIDASHTLFEGRALAIVRPTGTGPIRVRAEAHGMEATEITIAAQ